MTRRSKALRQKGLEYEKLFADWCTSQWGEVHHGMWLSDEQGAIQPDVVVRLNDKIYCFECKRTYRPIAAKKKLFERYIPALEKLWEMPTYGIQVFSKFGPRGRAALGRQQLIRNKDELAQLSATNPYCVWLWRGHTPHQMETE